VEADNTWKEIKNKLILFFLSYSLGLIFISVGVSFYLVELYDKNKINKLSHQIKPYKYFDQNTRENVPDKDMFKNTNQNLLFDKPTQEQDSFFEGEKR
jgi:hypothetical protein